MKLQEIKDAVRAGMKVHWLNDGYEVIEDELGQWFTSFESGRSYIGLTHQDGVTLNGEESEFYIGDPVTKAPSESGDVFKVWISVERINDDKDEFENIGEPEEFGSYGTLEEALDAEACLINGGVTERHE